MIQTITLPAPQLSELKQVTVDLDMTGRHYALLATSINAVPEDLALSILHGLMKENPDKLTMAELRYVFTLVKIHSLEDKYTATITCACGCDNVFDMHLSDSDLNRTPDDYVVPTIDFATEKDKTKEYQIIPPCMDMESALYNWFLTEKNKTLDDIAKDLGTSMEYTFIRSCMHLTSNGERLVTQANQFETVLTWLDVNKYSTIEKLYEKCLEVDSFGVQNTVRTEKCKECGKLLTFQLPLLYGLTD